MESDSQNYGRGTGSDQGPSGQGPKPPAQQQIGKYRPPHLRNQGSDAGGGPYVPPLQQQGVGPSCETGRTQRPWDPPPAPHTHRTSQLTSNPCTFGVDLLKISEQVRVYRPPQAPTQQPRQQGVGPGGGSTGSWTGRPWRPSPSSSTPVESVPPPEAPSQPSPASDERQSGSKSETWKILSYNVWFREDLEMCNRMKALGNLIELHEPDVICFQEVTPSFYDIFQQSSWWKKYCCSISNEDAIPGAYFCMQLCKLPIKSYSSQPFHNSIMGRELCVAEVEVQQGILMVVATSHLESPCPRPPTWDQMFSKERVAQANEAVRFLDRNPNVIFCGDMNWDDELDGPFPLPDGWLDAWTQLKPGEFGWTYDTKSNKMLSGNRTLQKRLDRFVCKLKDFKISEIQMIGTDAIPGLTYIKEKRFKGQVKELGLPVLPSDHYGLLLTICPSNLT